LPAANKGNMYVSSKKHLSCI